MKEIGKIYSWRKVSKEEVSVGVVIKLLYNVKREGFVNVLLIKRKEKWHSLE